MMLRETSRPNVQKAKIHCDPQQLDSTFLHSIFIRGTLKSISSKLFISVIDC